MKPGEIIRPETLEWLLEQSNPSVRFWALQHLLGKGTSSEEVRNTQNAIMESKCVKTILGSQNLEGHWNNRDSMYLPKYTASTHSLLILAELGARRTDSIEKALEYVFLFQRDSGHFLVNLPKTDKGRVSDIKDGCCIDGNILYYMVHFGYLKDPRVERLIQFQVDYHSDDVGGWKCRSYPIDPNRVVPANCYMGGVKLLRGLAAIPVGDRSSDVRRIIDQEAEIILENGVYRYLRTSSGARKDKAGWKRFGFPLFYQSDILEVLDILTTLCIRDSRMQDAIGLVESQMTDEGRWLLKNTFNGKMICDIEEKEQPSKWITLRALRTLSRYYDT